MEKFIPIQRREKLKSLLIVKFMKKYGLKNPEKVLEDEVAKFLKGEKLTDSDLRRFDIKVKEIIEQTKNQDNLMQNLTGCASVEEIPSNKLPDINNDNISVKSAKSKHSIHSKASKASAAKPASRYGDNKPTPMLTTNNYINDELDFDNISIASIDSRRNKYKPTMNFEGDNWDLIAKYNQKKFEEEKRENKIKDKEIKRRIKDDLDVQIRAKLLRENEELKRNREFDNVVLKHVENMNQLEREKEAEVKHKIMKEKYSRDVQLKDEMKRKKIEVLKNRKFDKEIGIYTVINKNKSYKNC